MKLQFIIVHTHINFLLSHSLHSVLNIFCGNYVKHECIYVSSEWNKKALWKWGRRSRRKRKSELMGCDLCWLHLLAKIKFFFFIISQVKWQVEALNCEALFVLKKTANFFAPHVWSTVCSHWFLNAYKSMSYNKKCTLNESKDEKQSEVSQKTLFVS